MIRSLYFKIGAAIVVASAISWLLVYLTRPWIEGDHGRRFQKLVEDSGLGYVVRAIDEASESERPRVLAEIAATTDLSIEVLSASEAKTKPAPRPTFEFSIDEGARVVRARPPPPPRNDLSRVLFPLYAFTLITLLSALFIATPITRRLRRLRAAALAMRDGDLSVRVSDGSKDAVGQVAAGFNAMAHRLQTLFEARERLLQAVSHEIGTPLSRLRFHTEALSEAASDDETQSRLRKVESEIVELDALAEELTCWVEADGRPPTLVDVPLAEALSPLADDDAKLDLDPELVVSADERQLQRAVGNLLSNARRFAKEQVVLHVARDQQMARIEVRDDGPGIAVEDRERLFEPFARVEASRNRSRGGMGLGLAIAERIVSAHGGEIWIEDAPEGGASLVIRWPLAARDT